MSKSLRKTIWFLLLFFDLVVFEQAIIHSNIPSLLLAAVLAAIIHFKGNEAMFGDFDRKRKAKLEARKKHYEELRQKNLQKGNK